MSNSLQANPAGTPPPLGAQTVSISGAQALGANTAQIPVSTGNVWFAFEVGKPKAILTVTFNGRIYPDVPPGQYTLHGVKTPLDLAVALENGGDAKLAWIVF